MVIGLFASMCARPKSVSFRRGSEPDGDAALLPPLPPLLCESKMFCDERGKKSDERKRIRGEGRWGIDEGKGIVGMEGCTQGWSSQLAHSLTQRSLTHFGLQISMDAVHAVQVLQRLQDLPEQRHRFFVVEDRLCSHRTHTTVCDCNGEHGVQVHNV